MRGPDRLRSGGIPGQVDGRRLKSLDELRKLFRVIRRRTRSGSGSLFAPAKFTLYQRDRKPGELDVNVLHQHLLGTLLGISEEAVRDEKAYRVRARPGCGLRQGSRRRADAAFLLEPTTMDQVAGVAFSGGVMPQKSTDFYPKLLSGLTIHKLER